MSFLSFVGLMGSSPSMGHELGEQQQNRGEEERLEVGGSPDVSPRRSTTQARGQDDESSLGLDSSTFSIEDHEVIVGFPPGTLIQIYRERCQEEEGSFSGTIVSSAPSDEHLRPPAPSPEGHRAEYGHELYAISPHPRFHVENALSISTTESVYRNVQSLENSVTDEVSADTSILSLPSSMDMSIVPTSWSTIKSTSDPTYHQVVERQISFRNVADRLAQLPPRRENAGEWFSHFTEQDWMQFRQAADMILKVLEPTCGSSSLALPPQVPSFPVNLPVEPTELTASDYLPEAFLCALCHDAIVGAMALSCACERSTVCAECWECCSFTDESGFLCIQTLVACPSCGREIDAAVPCHALDVAVLHTVKNTPESVQHAYYHRLNEWRMEVLRRRAGERVQHSPRHDLLLAQLIQEEEEHFWNKNSAKQHSLRRALLFMGEIALGVAVASLSAVGMAVLSRRR